MSHNDDKDYMQWWQAYGEMANPEVEYPAWKAGRAFQHQFEKSAQQRVQRTAGTPADIMMKVKEEIEAVAKSVPGRRR